LTKFLSDEWIEKAKEVVEKNLDPKEDMKYATTSLLNIIENVPPKKTTVYLYISFENGNLSDLLIKSDDSMKNKETEFTVIGDYNTFVQIVKGEMSTIMAVLKNRVRLKGDKMKALRYTKPIDSINRVLSKIVTEYDEGY
jgi:putative sterol carrier protein